MQSSLVQFGVNSLVQGPNPQLYLCLDFISTHLIPINSINSFYFSSTFHNSFSKIELSTGFNSYHCRHYQASITYLSIVVTRGLLYHRYGRGLAICSHLYLKRHHRIVLCPSRPTQQATPSRLADPPSTGCR